MKLTSILLVALLLFATYARAAAGPRQQARDGARVEKVRSGIRKLGVGESARVEVRLADGSKVKGYVREAGEESFVVVDRKTGAARTVGYEEVGRLKGRGMSTGAKVALGFGIAAAVLATLALIGLHYSD